MVNTKRLIPFNRAMSILRNKANFDMLDATLPAQNLRECIPVKY